MGHHRLISCLLLLQGERRRTARELAAALEVSRRTVYRDVEALSAAGVPIHMERGPNGGIVLADDYRRAIAQFTDEELQALFATAAGPMADLGMASFGHALAKLAGALPPAQRRALERGRDRLLLDHSRWYLGAQPTELLASLRKAVAADRRVHLQYRDRGGATTDRVVDPLGLVAKAGVWYLVAREPAKGYRTFRAERIATVAPTTQTFERPSEFDLDAYWQSSVKSLQRLPPNAYLVTLRLRSDAVDRAIELWNADVLAVEHETTTLRIRFPHADIAVAMIVAWGDAATIVEPAELRNAVVAKARAALARNAAGAA